MSLLYLDLVLSWNVWRENFKIYPMFFGEKIVTKNNRILCNIIYWFPTVDVTLNIASKFPNILKLDRISFIDEGLYECVFHDQYNNQSIVLGQTRVTIDCKLGFSQISGKIYYNEMFTYVQLNPVLLKHRKKNSPDVAWPWLFGVKCVPTQRPTFPGLKMAKLSRPKDVERFRFNLRNIS